MAFQAFLGGDQKDWTARRQRAHLQSGLLHGALLLLLTLAGRTAAPPAPVSVARMPLAVPVMLPRLSPAPAAAAAPAGPSVALTPRPPRRRPTLAAPMPQAPAYVPVLAATAPSGADGTTLDPQGDNGGGDQGMTGGGHVGEGAGGGRPGRRRAELFARIIGSGIRPGTAVRSDRPYISLKEATALRTSDFFPRLPAALWTERAPYMVALEVCVSEQGWVSEASLRSHASERLDPIVLAAVRGWRYQPWLQDGRPSPFCHGVLIRYEVTY